MKKYLALLLIALLTDSAMAAEATIEVIPLSNRPAAEIIPLLAPLLDGNAQLVDNGSNLLVKAAPGKLAEIKAIVNQLDVRQSNLMITVMQTRQANAEEMNASAGIQVNGSQSGVDGRAIGHFYQTQDKDADSNTQRVRTLDGVPAHIKVGGLYPQQNYSVYGYPSETNYTEATTGFAVVPRLTGQQVVLSVSPWSDRINGRGHIDVQNAEATLRINLGEWVELGGIGASSTSNANGTMMNTRQTSNNQMHILLKVDRVD